MSLILAVEPRQSQARVGGAGDRAGDGLRGGELGEVSAGRGPRLVGAVRAIAEIVVDLGGGELDGWVRDTCEAV
jgi:hypothetical protein